MYRLYFCILKHLSNYIYDDIFSSLTHIFSAKIISWKSHFCSHIGCSNSGFSAQFRHFGPRHCSFAILIHNNSIGKWSSDTLTARLIMLRRSRISIGKIHKRLDHDFVTIEGIRQQNMKSQTKTLAEETIQERITNTIDEIHTTCWKKKKKYNNTKQLFLWK